MNERERPDDGLDRAPGRFRRSPCGFLETEVALDEHITVPPVRRDGRHHPVARVHRVRRLKRLAAIHEPPTLGVGDEKHARLEMLLEKRKQERFVPRSQDPDVTRHARR